MFEELRIGHRYLPVEIRTEKPSNVSTDELSELRSFLQSFRQSDADCSIVVSNPFKQVIAGLCDELSPEAARMGAVNLLYKRNNLILGRNIDGQALMLGQSKSIKNDFRSTSVCILGCGGVSTSVSFSFAAAGAAKMRLFDIEQDRSKELFKKLSKSFPSLDLDILSEVSDVSGFDVIYNGTGIGKESHDNLSVLQSPISPDCKMTPATLAIDANYTPWKTRFLEICESHGCSLLNGFSHMVGFTTLHLSEVLGLQLDYTAITKIAERYVQK